MDKLNVFRRIFAPQPTVPLGRWRLKHDSNACEKYLINCYGEPGYPNKYKNEWIHNLQKKTEADSNQNNTN